MIPPRWTWPYLAALAAGLLVRLLGLRLGDAVLVGLVTLVGALVWAALPAGEEDPWPPDRRDDAAGARSEIAVLTWAFLGRDGRVTEAAVRRLRDLAARRLARLGMPVAAGLGPRPASAAPDPERDRARAVLGERAWAALTAPGGHMPSLADVAHCVDVVERLDPPRPPTGGPRP